MLEKMKELVKADETIIVMDAAWLCFYLEDLAHRNGLHLDGEEDYELMDELIEWIMD